ncbi:LppU/SCO3897 family protein [Micromonospora sp. LOL_023]|uniref:LppU/SCO3897 family protein n=1 Tax=Micromonospora sp. LOL_023 TaxID=3345418 RepID=UPI003A88241C
MSQYGPPGGPYPDQQPDRWADRHAPEPFREPSDPWGGNDPWGGTPPPAGPQQPWHGENDPNWQAGQPPAAQPDWQAGQPPAAQPNWQGYGQQTSAGDQNWHSATQPAPGWAGAAEQTWQQPGAGQHQQPPAAPAWEPTAAPGRPGKKSGGVSGALLAVVIGLAVLLCGGGAVGIYLINRAEPQNGGEGLAVPTTDPQVDPAVVPSAGTDPTPEPVQDDDPTPAPTPTASNDARFVTVGQCVRNEADGEEDDATPVLAITECDAGAYEVLARFDGVTEGEEDAKTKCADVTGYTNWYFFNSQLDALDFVLCLKQR